MKRVYALMLTAILLLAAVNTAFAVSYDATVTLTGYEIGKSITDIGVEIDNLSYKVVPMSLLTSGTQVNALIGIIPASGYPVPLEEGIFEEGTEYVMDIYSQYVDSDDLTKELSNTILNANFCLDNGSLIDMSFKAMSKVFAATFKLPVLHNPVQEAELPKTGDESSVLLWSALACISLFGMTMLVRKRKEA